MSGPKVVRIVTREEMQTMCRGLMRAFELAATELIRQAKRYDLMDGAIERDITTRRQQLAGLFDGDKWAEIRRVAPAMTAYATAQIALLHSQALAAAEAARSKRRHLTDSARSLILSLENEKRSVPDSLREVAQRALQASDEQLESMYDIVQRALRSEVRGDGGGRSDEDSALARRLGAGYENQSFAEWKASRAPLTRDASSARLDKLLAEVEIDEDPEIARRFIERSAEIVFESSEARRTLLTDSLTLEVAARVAQRRQHESVVGKLREIEATLEGLATPAAMAMADTISKALATGEMSASQRLIADGNALSEREARELAATARRRAVLSGLSSLGYVVREGMTTSWVRDGRVILRKPGTQDYGIELGGAADATRLQIRLVGSDSPASPRSAQRDQDHETIWCSEFGKLQDLIARSRGELVLERAQPVGAVAVKTISMEASEEEIRDIERPLGARTV
jgi:hypothetical protein